MKRAVKMKWAGPAALLLGAVLLSLVLLSAAPSVRADADAGEQAALIAEADRLADEEKFEESNRVLLRLVKLNPDHPDVYWKIAKNYYDLGERIPIEENRAKKLDMYVRCERYAKTGYDKNPDLADNAFWMAVGMSQQAQTKGIASTILSDRGLPSRIEAFYIKATQATEYHYRTEDTDTVSAAHFALGMFYRKLPESRAAEVLLRTRGDMDKSVEHHRIAVKMHPHNIDYNKELGVSLLCRGQRRNQPADIEEGKKYLNKAISLPAKSSLDRMDQADSKRLLEDHSLACGYSRVQQEEVGDSALK